MLCLLNWKDSNSIIVEILEYEYEGTVKKKSAIFDNQSQITLNMALSLSIVTT